MTDTVVLQAGDSAIVVVMHCDGTMSQVKIDVDRLGTWGLIIDPNPAIWRAQHSQSHYAAAKAGVMALTRCSAIEAVECGVRINAVSPSIARHKFLDKTTSADLLDRLSADEAFGRAAEPWEVAATIAFLASEYSSYLTGRSDLGLQSASVMRL
jgi:NAD(P)-dependent dehydrogenase (short-subunit alcohol dehydrogenase family)